VYKGKIKLHGTNVAVSIQQNGKKVFVQSRKSFLTKEKDHHDFAKWALENSRKNYFKSLFKFRAGYRSLTIFGEWCGKGIMRGAAITELEHRIFAVFAILKDSNRLIVTPKHIEEILNAYNNNNNNNAKDDKTNDVDSVGTEKINRPDNIYVVPWCTQKFSLSMVDEASLLPQIEKINALVEAIDKEDPWVKKQFGVTGTGEGLVWYPISSLETGKSSSRSSSSSVAETPYIPFSKFTDLVFKTKGVSHSVVINKESMSPNPVAIHDVDTFIAAFVTKQRLEQAWEEVINKDKKEGKKITPQDYLRNFVDWVKHDVKKESEAEWKKSNLSWDIVQKEIYVQAKKYFFKELRKVG